MITMIPKNKKNCRAYQAATDQNNRIDLTPLINQNKRNGLSFITGGPVHKRISASTTILSVSALITCTRIRIISESKSVWRGDPELN